MLLNGLTGDSASLNAYTLTQDGRVQMLVEGSEEAIGKFLNAVRARWKDNIEKEQAEEQAKEKKAL